MSGDIYYRYTCRHELKSGYSGRYGHRRDMETLLGYLPQSIGMYETSGNDKKYLII